MVLFSKVIFIYDIENNFVQDLSQDKVFSSIYFELLALHVSETNDGISKAVITGYYQFDIEKNLPVVYLVRLNPLFNMTFVDNYIQILTVKNLFADVILLLINLVMVCLFQLMSQLSKSFLAHHSLRQKYPFSFNSTNLT